MGKSSAIFSFEEGVHVVWGFEQITSYEYKELIHILW